MRESSYPWSDPDEWQQVRISLVKTTASMGGASIPLIGISRQIAGAYLDLEDDLDDLCSRTCLFCNEICCTRATVWFDLPDLLYIYLLSGDLPPRQMYRDSDGACCKLSRNGCVEQRMLRPFICTWYICAAQKRFDQKYRNILHRLERIRNLRKKLEDKYVSSACRGNREAAAG